jgi:hypothetical protein
MIPNIVPIINASQHTSNGCGGQVAIFMTIVAFFVLLLVYEIVIIVGLVASEYSTKKQFLKDLIPFNMWIRNVIKSFVKME